MNAYGPSFHYITPNHVVFENVVVHRYFDLQIDLKLNQNTETVSKSNVFGVQVKGEPYENVGSQIPALFLQPNGMTLEVCMQFENANLCEDLAAEVPADEWFSLYFEQWCWLGEGCSFYVLREVDGAWTIQWYWWNDSPMTFENVQGVIGNTYGDEEFPVANGKYKNFQLNQEENRSAPSSVLSGAGFDASASNQAGAANA